MKTLADNIDIDVACKFVAEQSQPEENAYVFAYSIRIHNGNDAPLQLINRYWKIIDAEEKVQEVEGEGVVGQQPTLISGETYQYSSGAVINHPPATMEGQYEFEDESGQRFWVAVPAFMLSLPGQIH